MFRYQMYQKLGERKGEFLKLVEGQAKKVNVPKAWQAPLD